jgi:hypothetical protein
MLRLVSPPWSRRPLPRSAAARHIGARRRATRAWIGEGGGVCLSLPGATADGLKEAAIGLKWAEGVRCVREKRENGGRRDRSGGEKKVTKISPSKQGGDKKLLVY